MTSEWRQTVLLTRTFFNRMFESDLMPSGLPQVQLLISVIAFLAGLSTVLPILLAKKYAWLIGTPDALLAAMSADRAIMTLLLMIATGLITLVIWEGLFPDARDARILGVIPIRIRTFVISRLAALMLLFAILVMTTTFASALSFGMINATFKGSGGFIRSGVSTFAASAGAEAVVFFGIITLQCALLNVAGPAVAHRLAVALQIALVVMLLQMPLLLSKLTSSPVPAAAPLAAVVVLVAAVVLYATTYRRLTRLALEGIGGTTRRSARFAGVVSGAARLATWSQPARAVCAFTLRTVARSRQHRMIFAGWVGLALAIILAGLVPLILRDGWAGFAQPRTVVLAAPLVLATLTLAGMRMLFGIPTQIKANWAIRTRQVMPVRLALDGATAALVVCVAPAVVLAGLSAAAFWDAKTALFHAVFCGLIGVILAQALSIGLDKVPFTCTYMPGKGKFLHLWPLYLTIFTTCTYTMASLESRLLRRGGAVAAIIIFAAAGAALALIRHHQANGFGSLRFEEEEDNSITLLPL